MKYTENYNLNKPDYQDMADVPASFNSNMDVIDTQLKERDTRVGPLASLSTTIKTSIVNAINSLLEDFNEHKADYVTEITNRIKKNGDVVTGLYQHNSRIFKGVLSHYLPSGYSNGIKIKTKVAAGQYERFILQIKGYSNGVAPNIIDLVAYVYTEPTSLSKCQITSVTNTLNPEIKIAYEDGFIVLLLSVKTIYSFIAVDAISQVDNRNYFTGWTALDENILPGATAITTIPYL